MDGRAPDTIARLKAKAPKKRTGTAAPPAPVPSEFQRSFLWQKNSCWLDSSLTVLFAVASRAFPQLQVIFVTLPPGHLLHELLSIIGKHIEQAALPGFDEGGCKVLANMRNLFRKSSSKENSLNLASPRMQCFSPKTEKGWLQQIIAKLIALKPAPDGASERCISFFRPYAVQVKKCPGCEAAPLEHWEVSHPLWRAPFQLSKKMHRIFGGDLNKWFRWLLDPSEWESAACWRQWEANPFCNGAAMAKEYILSIPVVLILEVGDSLGSPWKVPPSLLPLGRKFSAEGVKYILAAQIYTNYTVKRGGSSHFIARYVTPDGTKIFDYDGMEHNGHARHRRGAKLSGWMSGPSDKLRDVPTGYRLVAIIYHLEGGVNGQQLFCAERRKTAPWGLQLDADPTNNRPFARFAQLVQPHLIQMTGDERADWASIRRQAQSLEYQVDNSEPQQPSRKDNVTETGRFQKDFIVIEESDADEQLSEHADQDSLDELILKTVEPTVPTQSKRHRTFSDSSNSATPCPINCYGCGEFSDGDDGPEQVQCSSCGFWSHFKCQPEDGEVDWNDPNVTFTCQGCRQRTPAELEIVMLPDPRVKDEWRGKHVLWYPARFFKHHPHIPKNEFEFRYLECIQWPLTEADLMGPSRYYSQDRALCEDMLKVELRPEQIGTIRSLAFRESNAAENHPLIEIFDAALTPLAILLVSFPDEHPVVRSYKLFFTDLATEDDDSRVDRWIAEPLFEPVKELTVLMMRPLEKLQDFRLVSVPGPERRRRVLTVGRTMLQLLAIQYELKEALNLNGDTFEDLVEGDIKRKALEDSEALRAMLVATKPKELTHKKYWDMEAFGKYATKFADDHTVPDPTYRPNTYRRDTPQEPRRPPIAIDIPRGTEDDEILQKFPIRTRPRKDSEDDEDIPAPKRQATFRRLRPRGNKGPHKEEMVAVPVGKVVASGKGWITIDVDDSDN
ncbi:hypothetical protein C8J57DRAFT_1251619 [Mycena rebaudengoi]|nr:hypothetical protein C8J57DRAFT_1251619 [Mycena rebaudengoi]